MNVSGLLTYLNQTLIFERCVVTFGFTNRCQIIHVFKRCWITCSKFVTHSRFNSRDNGVCVCGGGDIEKL